MVRATNKQYTIRPNRNGTNTFLSEALPAVNNLAGNCSFNLEKNVYMSINTNEKQAHIWPKKIDTERGQIKIVGTYNTPP